MAKIRDLKKDVNFLTSEVISQAFFVQYLFPETKEEKLSAVIEKAVLLRNNTIKSINGYKKEGKVKAFYREIQEKFVKEVFELFDALNKLKK
ncbi:hypothetical protein ACE01N_14050 [Saccharicrinis sp. FJH2]|uniref:hypothetical protein n=1 Tax=Saccharicrinis sp. FJH65 TaxID=3344659 RepID=UPI0035F30070